MSGGSKTTQQSTSSNTLDPQFKGLVMDNFASAQKNAGLLGGAYGGQLTAGFTPVQLQAQQQISNVATDPTYAANNNAAISGIKNAGTIADADLSQYTNPYNRDVINTTIADQERARQMAISENHRRATAAHAFGGSRGAVEDALTNEGYDRNTGGILAGLNQSNYANAQNMAQSDITNRMNQAQGILGANGAALQTASAQGGLLSAVGDAQQQQKQTELSALYQDWMTGKQLTMDQQNLLNSALGLVPVQQTLNSSGSGTETKSPGFTDILGSIGSLAKGLGSMGVGIPSDGRAKKDIQTIGHDRKGRRWVSFRYIWDGDNDAPRRGVIAQEVINTDPGAVSMGSDGFYRVDYSALHEAA